MFKLFLAFISTRNPRFEDLRGGWLLADAIARWFIAPRSHIESHLRLLDTGDRHLNLRLVFLLEIALPSRWALRHVHQETVRVRVLMRLLRRNLLDSGFIKIFLKRSVVIVASFVLLHHRLRRAETWLWLKLSLSSGYESLSIWDQSLDITETVQHPIFTLVSWSNKVRDCFLSLSLAWNLLIRVFDNILDWSGDWIRPRSSFLVHRALIAF